MTVVHCRRKGQGLSALYSKPCSEAWLQPKVLARVGSNKPLTQAYASLQSRLPKVEVYRVRMKNPDTEGGTQACKSLQSHLPKEEVYRVCMKNPGVPKVVPRHTDRCSHTTRRGAYRICMNLADVPQVEK